MTSLMRVALAIMHCALRLELKAGTYAATNMKHFLVAAFLLAEQLIAC